MNSQHGSQSGPQRSDGSASAAGAGDARAAATELKETLRETGREVTEQAKHIAQDLRERSRDYRERAMDQAETAAMDGMGRAADELRHISQALGRACESLRESDDATIARYAEEARRPIDSVADYLSSREPREVLQDAGAFVRRQPALTIGVLALAGFAAGRIIKASADRRRNSDAAGDQDLHNGQDWNESPTIPGHESEFAPSGAKSSGGMCAHPPGSGSPGMKEQW